MATPKRRKIVIVGDGACGKTSLLMVFTTGRFPAAYTPTVFECHPKEMTVDGEVVLTVHLWDTSGQEDYERVRRLVFLETHSVIICYSFDNADSLQNVQKKWIREVRAHHVPVVLVGAKADLVGTPAQQVTSAMGRKTARKIGAVAYLECSAKCQMGVDDVFRAAAEAAIHHHPNNNKAKSKTRSCRIC